MVDKKIYAMEKSVKEIRKRKVFKLELRLTSATVTWGWKLLARRNGILSLTQIYLDFAQTVTQEG
jgi:hypothetical protein